MTGVKSIGVRCPIFREGDDIVSIVCDEVIKSVNLQDKDVIGITESVVARVTGNYVTVDEIAEDIKKLLNGSDSVCLYNPIYSRNRFSMILKAFARAAKYVYIVMPEFDEVGNPNKVNKWTGVNIAEYYSEICKNEHATCYLFDSYEEFSKYEENAVVFYCGLHHLDKYRKFLNLTDICHDKCEYGLLGSNKATEEKIKLFPDGNKALYIIQSIQKEIENRTGKHVEVMVYGDGCFKDPVAEIWEFADPIVSPAYTMGLDGNPNEIKIKAFADDQFGNLSGDALTKAVKNQVASKDSELIGSMCSQGTTPRRYVDLLGSLMDLTSGSGDKGTPVVVVQNYFTNYASE